MHWDCLAAVEPDSVISVETVGKISEDKVQHSMFLGSKALRLRDIGKKSGAQFFRVEVKNIFSLIKSPLCIQS